MGLIVLLVVSLIVGSAVAWKVGMDTDNQRTMALSGLLALAAVLVVAVSIHSVVSGFWTPAPPREVRF